jgi:hypothetical protein
VVAVKLLHAVYAMLKRTGNPTTPHVSSSRRRRLGLDISWDVSVGMAGGSLGGADRVGRAGATGSPGPRVLAPTAGS